MVGWLFVCWLDDGGDKKKTLPKVFSFPSSLLCALHVAGSTVLCCVVLCDYPSFSMWEIAGLCCLLLAFMQADVKCEDCDTRNRECWCWSSSHLIFSFFLSVVWPAFASFDLFPSFFTFLFYFLFFLASDFPVSFTRSHAQADGHQ